MLLALDVGNTNVTIGVFDGDADPHAAGGSPRRATARWTRSGSCCASSASWSQISDRRHPRGHRRLGGADPGRRPCADAIEQYLSQEPLFVAPGITLRACR